MVIINICVICYLRVFWWYSAKTMFTPTMCSRFRYTLVCAQPPCGKVSYERQESLQINAEQATCIWTFNCNLTNCNFRPTPSFVSKTSNENMNCQRGDVQVFVEKTARKRLSAQAYIIQGCDYKFTNYKFRTIHVVAWIANTHTYIDRGVTFKVFMFNFKVEFWHYSWWYSQTTVYIIVIRARVFVHSVQHTARGIHVNMLHRETHACVYGRLS